MAKEVALMNKDKVIAYLEYYPQIDGEIAERRRNRNELDMAYAPAGAIQYDGMPKGKNNISRPTEDIAIDMPDFVRKEIRSYTESIHRTEDIEQVMTDTLIRFKTRLLAVPAKVSPILAKKTNQTEIFEIIKSATDEALEELADFDSIFGETDNAADTTEHKDTI